MIANPAERLTETIQVSQVRELDKNAYDATKAELPTIWQIGNCTVLDNAGNEIK